jgi:hypothetical protein
MEATAAHVPRAHALASVLRFDRRAIGAWTLGFAPVLYLALRGGGYDTVVYSEVSLAAWWIVLVGAVACVLPLQRLGRLAWVGIGLLTAFAAWTLIGTSWSTDAEQTIAQLGRVASYLGFFVLGLCVLRRDTVRPLVTGIGAAIGIVGLLATLSRLYPGAFPHNQVLTFFPGSNNRLNYPLNYADGTGEFLAIGLPLLLSIATGGRTLVGRALGAAAIPVSVLALVMTASRGAVITAVVALIAFYFLAPERLSKLATGLAATAGSVTLVAALLHRAAVKQGLSSQLAVTQRHQMTALVVVVCVGVALIQIGISLATRYAAVPKSLRVSRRRATQATLAALAVAIVVAVAAGVPGQLSHQWNIFKRTDTTGVASGNVYSRLGSVAGSHRYQYWSTAWHAFQSKPLTGTGPGTFQFYWNQHSPFFESIVNAHSLYLETLAEAGLIGFALIVGLLVALLGAGIWTVMRAPPLARVSLAGATAAFVGFCTAAGFDWVWQLPAIPIAALLLGAAIVACREHRPRERTRRWSGPALRGGVAVLALAAAVAIAIPLGATTEYRSSQTAARSGNFRAALSDALTAQSLEPYAATPRLQKALVYEAVHDFPAASVAIAQATARGADNWQLWLVRARIDAESGRARAAVRDFRRAHALNPLSPATVE